MTVFEEKIADIRLVPVVSLPDVESGLKLCAILNEQGMNAVEITFRTECAEEAISRIKKRYPNMLVLAGTVLTPEQVRVAAGAGADALVSPGCEPAMVQESLNLGLPVIPGVCTPSEVQTAMGFGLTRLKFFPAELSGGTKMVKTLLSVYRTLSLMPTGGITLENLSSYLDLERVFCCGGTWLAPESLLAQGEWGVIEKRIDMAMKMIS
ncbi:MAG: bifunctional 4-hydroxy-2-oxoglutarate aldolase/2-dehydro-3-deoxy-phosphogluconate aldolase [Desulfovibrio sp.]|nr:MAG: bifunctional 4-hydroxy-2-oxoglutarate aldolase/2-dehydro-3-deoxy-phosphogluconate aldolase [Desulfovibrio sp.]